MRKKGLVERIVMKAPSSEDFSPSKLPKNRKELFGYMLKNKFGKIYKNHLLIALFFIPLIAWNILSMPYTNAIFTLEAREGITHLVEYWFTVYVTAIPLWALAFVGLSGGLNVIRKLSWSDPIVLKLNFIQGIKSSGKQMALIGCLWGSAFAVIRYAIDWLSFYYRVFDSSYSVVFGIFVCVFLLTVIVGLTVYMTCMCSIYNVSFKQLFVGAFKLYYSDFFLATGVILVCLSPILILMTLGLAITVLIAYLLSLLLLIGIIIIPMFLVCQHTFDRIINKKDYPNYYGKGLSYGTYKDSGISLKKDPSVEENLAEEIENDFERVNDD